MLSWEELKNDNVGSTNTKIKPSQKRLSWDSLKSDTESVYQNLQKQNELMKQSQSETSQIKPVDQVEHDNPGIFSKVGSLISDTASKVTNFLGNSARATTDFIADTPVFRKAADMSLKNDSVGKFIDTSAQAIKGIHGAAKGIAEGVTDTSSADVPFVGTGIAAGEGARFLTLSNKIKEGNLDESDTKFVTDYIDKINSESEKNKDFGYSVGSGIRQSATFMAELGLASFLAPETGGGSLGALFAGKSGIKASLSAAKELIKDKATREILLDISKKQAMRTGVETAIVAGAHTPEGAVRRMTGTPEFKENGDFAGLASDGQSLAPAIVNSLSENAVSVLSERVGGAFNLFGKPVKESLIKSGVLKSFLKSNPDIPPSKVADIVKAGGWDGILSEYMEERVGDVMNGALEKVGLGDQEFKMPTVESTLKEIAQFAIMGTAIKAVDKAFSGKGKNVLQDNASITEPQTTHQEAQPYDFSTDFAPQDGDGDIIPDAEIPKSSPEKVTALFDAIDSQDDTKIVETMRDMSKNNLEDARKVLETVKENSDENALSSDELLKIEDHLEKIDALLAEKNTAIEEKAKQIVLGGVTEEEISNLHEEDVPHSIKVIEKTLEVLDIEKYDLLAEKKNTTDKQERKQIQSKIDAIDADRHAIDNGLKSIKSYPKRKKKPINTVEDADKEITKRIEKFRKESGTVISGDMADGVGVRQRIVSDATGNVNFVANDFKKSTAKFDMKKRAGESKKYSKEVLYENDPEFRALVDKRDELFEKKLNEATTEIDVQSIFDELDAEIETLSNNMQSYEGKQETTRETKKSPGTGKKEARETQKKSIKKNTTQNMKFVASTEEKSGPSLEEEARKYDTAEEFVKAHGIDGFHGTTAKFDTFDINKTGSATDDGMYGKGFYFADNLSEANRYSRGTGEVKQVKLDLRNPYIINSKKDIPKIDVPTNTIEEMKNSGRNYSKAFTDYLKSKGYDGVIDNIQPNNKQYVVFSPDQIKTKSQLQDIWKEAHKKSEGTLNDSKTLKSISDEDVQTFISKDFIEQEIKVLKENMDPFLAKKLIMDIVPALVEETDTQKLYSAGQFSKFTGIAEISQTQDVKTMREAVIHEPAHFAWTFLTDEEKSSIIREIEGKSLQERRNVFGKSALGGWRYDMYVREYENNKDALMEEMAVTIASKEALLSFDKTGKMYSGSKNVNKMQQLIQEFVRLYNMIASAISKKYAVKVPFLKGMDVMREIYNARGTFFYGRNRSAAQSSRSMNSIIGEDGKPESLGSIYKKTFEKMGDIKDTPKDKTPKDDDKVPRSAMAIRLNEALPDGSKIEELYDVKHIKDEATKAGKKIKKNKDAALREAFSKDAPVTDRNMLLGEFGEIARRDGDMETLNSLLTARRKNVTESAQALALEKAFVVARPEEKFMQDVIRSRLAAIKVGKGDLAKAMKEIRKTMDKKAKKIIKKTKISLKIERAQALFDSLIC